ERDGCHRQGREDLAGRGVLGLGLVQQLQRPLAGTPAALDLRRLQIAHDSPAQARVRYSPVRVSTLMRSPEFTNSGTCTTRPVSSVAGLRAPDTRSPWMPGSVSVTVSSTAAAMSVPMISSL